MADTSKPAPGQPFDSTALEVLVVDDEPEVRELLVEYFQNKGLRVGSATDGRAAVAAIQRDPSRFHLVLTDLQLPHVDGLGVLRAARQANPSCVVVIITGYASLESAIGAVRLGAYDYLTKPFSLGQIDVILHRLQERLALEAENRRLTRQLGQREPADPRAQFVSRLDAIEARLARIESLLREGIERRETRVRS